MGQALDAGGQHVISATGVVLPVANTASVILPGSIAGTIKPRFLEIDGFRGYLLLMMMVAHYRHIVQSHIFYLHHSHFTPIYDGELFVALSGLVCALAYQGIYARNGFRACLRAVLGRVRWLYGYQIAVTAAALLLLYAAWPLTIFPEYRPSPAPLAQQAIGLLTLALQPRFLDILPLYMTLMLFIPVALALLNRGHVRIYLGLLVASSLIAWTGIDSLVFQQIDPSSLFLSKWGLVRGLFNPWSYALLFFGAFLIGYVFKRAGSLAAMPKLLQPDHRIFAVAVAVSVILAVLEVSRSRLGTPRWVYEPDRERISPIGLSSTLSIGYIFYYLLAAPALGKWTGALAHVIRSVLTFRPLVSLGSNSLFVYAAHSLLLIGGVEIMTATGHLGRGSADLAIVTTAGLLLTLAGIKKRYLPKLP